MKFTFQTIMSMPVDGASSHLLIINNTIKILLDCGISHSFDFKKYAQKAAELKNVCLVLISHSRLEYSGAMYFLIDELNLNPKIFYTSQSIMRYSPLNLHEELLIMRFPNYGKKVFNRIYKIYENINIIKTQQKKSIEFGEENSEKIVPVSSSMEAEEPEAAIGQVEKIIYFTCYSSGGNIGSLTWRISYGIVNILYLVDYNNYSLYHINGLDMNLVMQPTDILITDTCENIEDENMKKTKLYDQVKMLIVNFYEKNGLSPTKPPTMTTLQNQKKLLITCYPNEMLIELMAVTKKVLQEIQPADSRQKIKVIHLSTRFLQLIKSQIDSFSPYFKETLENIEQFYVHSKTISGRINLATAHSVDGLLSDSLNKFVEICHIGPEIREKSLMNSRQKVLSNIMSFKLFLPDEKLLHSSSKIDQQKEQEDEIENEMKQQDVFEIKSEKQEPISLKDETEIIAEVGEVDLLLDDQQENQFAHLLHGKYLSQIEFPHFVGKVREEDHDFDDYGMRHKYIRFEDRKTIEDYKKEVDEAVGRLQVVAKKNSTIQVRNIEFSIPQLQKFDESVYNRILYLPYQFQKTNFNSSAQILLTIHPKNVIFINTKTTKISKDDLMIKYLHVLKSQQHNIKLLELAPKNICHIEIENQLISYKVNYIPIPLENKLQKVKGLIKYSKNGLLEIHLSCEQDKQLLNFRMDKFYKQLKMEGVDCVFTQRGIVVEGVRIYREDKRIVLEGWYSQQYFKVRRLLYNFLKLQ